MKDKMWKQDSDSNHPFPISKSVSSKVPDNPIKNDARNGVKSSLSKFSVVRESLAMLYCLMDIRTPIWSKLMVLGTLVYLVSPIDFVPDILVLLGLTDDAALVAIVIKLLRRQVTEEHRQKVDQLFNNKK